jgi:hypothetical protein
VVEGDLCSRLDLGADRGAGEHVVRVTGAGSGRRKVRRLSATGQASVAPVIAQPGRA